MIVSLGGKTPPGQQALHPIVSGLHITTNDNPFESIEGEIETCFK
jgi:hypothetical protein